MAAPGSLLMGINPERHHIPVLEAFPTSRAAPPGSTLSLPAAASRRPARGSQEPVVPLSCRPLSRLQLINPVASVHGWRPVC